MRIVGGKYRGKVLLAPEGMTTRPTADRARESVFNIIDSRLIKLGKSWAELRVFDAFAGTGALGLEAVSRGSMTLFAAEKDKNARLCWQKNTQNIKDCALKLFDDMLSLPIAEKPVDLLLMDPPYQKGLVYAGLCEMVKKGWISADTLCIIEVEKNENDVLPADFIAQDTRTYGRAKIIIAYKKD